MPIRPGVHLEVLDWGGQGPPLLFLSGLEDNAHEFDDVAPLADDIRLVLDRLHLQRVDLVGHSYGGDEISKFASTYPTRVRRIVYLDAAHDRTGLLAVLQASPVPSPPPMTAADSASPAAVVLSATEHPAYSRIRAPALGIYAVADSAMQLFAGYGAMSSADASRARRAGERILGWAARERDRFRREMPHARVVELRGANHYVFVSNEAEVESAIRGLLCAPEPARSPRP